MAEELEELDWQAQAACKGLSDCDALFFPERNQYTRVKEAKAMCASCPVRKECLNYALKHQVTGIWGATTEKDRRKIRSMMGIRAIPLSA